MQNTTLTENLIRLMKEAGDIILSAHKTSHVDDGVTVKPGTANFVTEYDVRVQEFLIAGIRRLLPTATFIAEEKENDPAVLESDYCFVIDPIDGTTNFIHDYRHSSISLAMISKGETVFGAVYDPYLAEIFSAAKGQGAYLNGERISVSDRPFSLAVAAYGTCPYYKDTLARKTFDLAHDVFLATSDLRRPGSAALDLAYLAAGRNDVYFEFILSPWDYAAGELILREAGGIATTLDGEPLTLERPCPVFAGTPTTHGDLLRLAQKYADEQKKPTEDSVGFLLCLL